MSKTRLTTEQTGGGGVGSWHRGCLNYWNALQSPRPSLTSPSSGRPAPPSQRVWSVSGYINGQTDGRLGGGQLTPGLARVTTRTLGSGKIHGSTSRLQKSSWLPRLPKVARVWTCWLTHTAAHWTTGVRFPGGVKYLSPSEHCPQEEFYGKWLEIFKAPKVADLIILWGYNKSTESRISYFSSNP